MSSDLPVSLERAATFLRLLPKDMPQPVVREFAHSLVLDFVKTRTNFVTVSIRPTGHLHYVGENGTSTQNGWAEFDGTAVPPEILKAIRRVAL